jgi:hypothetical protein
VADAHDANPDTSANHDANPPPTPDSGPSLDDGACAAQNPCPPCCHTTHGASFEALERAAVNVGCICADGGATDCTTACSTTVCAGNFTGAIPSGCNQCLDMRLGSPACGAIPGQCGVECKPALDCLQSCTGP